MKKYKTSKIIVFLIIKTYYFTIVTRVHFPYAFYLLAGLRSRLIFTGSGSGSGPWLLQAAPAPAPFFSSGSGSKEPKTPDPTGSGSPALLIIPLSSVWDPYHFDADPDPDPKHCLCLHTNNWDPFPTLFGEFPCNWSIAQLCGGGGHFHAPCSLRDIYCQRCQTKKFTKYFIIFLLNNNFAYFYHNISFRRNILLCLDN